MGCTNSKGVTAPKKGGKKGNKRAKGAKKGSTRNVGSDDDSVDEPEQEIVIVEAKPDILRKDIAKAYKAMSEKRDRLKPQLRPLLGERRGLNAMLEEERQRLMTLLETKTELEEQKAALLSELFNTDAEAIHRAYETSNKEAYVMIFACRTRWQLDEINKVYEEKYKEPMSKGLLDDGSKILGRSNLCKLLYYRMQPQHERDGQLIREFTKGFSVQDENLLEIVLTRSNVELKAALDFFTDEYGVPLKDILASHSYKNYREFMAKVFECNRDERNEPYPNDVAMQMAEELYQAGAGRSIGMNPEPFIRILAPISKKQFDSINEVYKEKKLLKDIDAKLGGDFALAVRIRCTDKYEYLASRLSVVFKAFTVDKDTICRIFGCVSRWECVKIREAYDKGEYGRTLDASLKNACSSEPNFSRALQLLCCGEMMLSPMGSDKELGEDEADVSSAGNRARLVAIEQYNRQSVFEKGDQLRRAGSTAEGSGDDDIPNFDMNEKCRTNDAVVLTSAMKELEDVKNQLDTLKETAKDEIVAIKESYFAINSHCYETETWIGLLKSHVKALQTYSDMRTKDGGIRPALQTSKSTYASFRK